MDCSGAGESVRCEPDGRCSVEDGECGSGWRYASSAAGLSGQCVAGADADLDLQVPVARVSAGALGCGETEVMLDGSASTAPPGATLVEFSWNILGPGYAVTAFAGAGAAPIAVDEHVRGGTLTTPTVNLTDYSGQRALKADLQATAGIDRIYQKSLTMGPGSYRLRFAAASASAGATLQVTIRRDPPDNTPIGLNEVMDLASAVTFYDLPFESTLTAADSLNRIQLRLRTVGTYWIDHLEIVETSSGMVISSNGDFEVDLTGWQKYFEDSGSMESAPWPAPLLQLGTYRAELQVRDSSGRQSEAAGIDLELTACP
jgi:hypothetical protein